MAGIVSFGTYIPLFRLKRDELKRAWGAPAIPGEKAVANYDEDSLTMAVAAGIDCLEGMDRSQVDGLYFATTTAPYKEKQSASTIACALDLKKEIFTGDFTDSLKASSSALIAAMSAVNSGLARQILVVSADSRLGAPQGSMEQLFGDGASAVLLGNTGIAANILGSHSITCEILDQWRDESGTFMRSWEDRFTVTYGYTATVREAVTGLMKKYNLTPKDITKAALYGPDPRSHTALGRALGLNPEQIQDPMFVTVGNTGAAMALMILAASLEDANGGNKILLATYGDGSDVFILEVTPEIEKVKGIKRHGVKGYLASKKYLSNYEKYMRLKDIVDVEPPRRPELIPLSISALWRDQKTNLSLYGRKCKECGAVQYPPQRVCVICQTRDNFEDVRLSDKKGKIFTFTHDNLVPCIDPPLTFAVVDFDIGGRTVTEVTDRDPLEINIDIPVEMTFRRLYSIGGINNYYWKARPIR